MRATHHSFDLPMGTYRYKERALAGHTGAASDSRKWMAAWFREHGNFQETAGGSTGARCHAGRGAGGFAVSWLPQPLRDRRSVGVGHGMAAPASLFEPIPGDLLAAFGGAAGDR